MLTSEKTEIQLRTKAFDEVKKNEKISNDSKMNSAIRRVGANIAKVTDMVSGYYLIRRTFLKLEDLFKYLELHLISQGF